MLNDARVALLGIFKDIVCTTRINKEKKFEIKFQVLLNSPKFCRTKEGTYHLYKFTKINITILSENT